MEEYTFSFPEYEVLKKHRARLQRSFDVRIRLPNLNGQNHSPPVYLTVKIEGEPRNIKYVKKFIKREMGKKTESNLQRTKSKPAVETLEPQESIPLITIDEEEDDFSEVQRANNTRGRGKKKLEAPNSNHHTSSNKNITTASSSPPSRNNQIVVTNSQTTNGASSPSCSTKNGSSNSPENADDSIVIVSEASSPSCIKENGSSNSPKSADDSIVIVSEASSPSCIKENGSLNSTESADDSIVIVSEVIVSSTSSLKDSKKVDKPLPEFIPLRVRNVQLPCENNNNNNKKRKLNGNQCVPASKERRVLRPIVIDGSNVARHHGKPFNTFSCKGIKICVDYFLKRGHTDVKVLLPHFRRFISHGSVVTTDGELLDQLELLNMVVYTPSRKVNERRITCYDDRFIVSLASQNNGVIVSNDNYRDIIMESPEFKKTIEERLLMFCFAGDIIMIPEDPLGSSGPSLTEFLSMRA